MAPIFKLQRVQNEDVTKLMKTLMIYIQCVCIVKHTTVRDNFPVKLKINDSLLVPLVHQPAEVLKWKKGNFKPDEFAKDIFYKI